MNRHLIVLEIAVLLTCVGLSGCSEQSSEESKFVGTWIDNTGEIDIFHEDGIVTASIEDDQGNYLHGTGTWKLENERLVIAFKGIHLFTAIHSHQIIKY